MAQAEIHPNGLAGRSGEHRLSAGLLLPEEESAPPRRTLDGAWGLPCEPAVRPCGEHSPGPAFNAEAGLADARLPREGLRE